MASVRYRNSVYTEVADEYTDAETTINGFLDYESEQGVDVESVQTALDSEADDYDPAAAKAALTEFATTISDADTATYSVVDEETMADEEVTSTGADFQEAVATMDKYDYTAPDPADYGVWIPGIPVLVENVLDKVGCAEWLRGLILDGIVAGLGAVLGFVPQILILFIFLAFLEGCGYMARVAFIMDRVFRKFGLSGKSFIPMLIGSGCGVPGIMASRTIENERDRRMTIMTTTFIPCGAKLPFIAMVAGAIFGGASWVAPSAYFLGIAAIICSGIILKKTKMFAGDPAPFVMELPAYHMPTIGSVLRSMWERGWSFIKKLVRLFWYLPSLYGSQLTSVSWTANSRCFPKTRSITVFWLRSVKQSAGSSFHRDGATGRQPLHLLQVWLQKRTLLVHWVSFTEAETQAFTQPWEQLSQQ